MYAHICKTYANISFWFFLHFFLHAYIWQLAKSRQSVKITVIKQLNIT